MASTSTVRVVLPAHLRTLSRVDGDVTLEIDGGVTIRAVLDALEARYPMLKGTIRNHGTLERRAFLRFFACEEDVSFESPDFVLPDRIRRGEEPFYVIGAIAGGEPAPAGHAGATALSAMRARRAASGARSAPRHR